MGGDGWRRLRTHLTLNAHCSGRAGQWTHFRATGDEVFAGPQFDLRGQLFAWLCHPRCDECLCRIRKSERQQRKESAVARGARLTPCLLVRRQRGVEGRGGKVGGRWFSRGDTELGMIRKGCQTENKKQKKEGTGPSTSWIARRVVQPGVRQPLGKQNARATAALAIGKVVWPRTLAEAEAGAGAGASGALAAPYRDVTQVYFLFWLAPTRSLRFA